jgi:hypothetical protein
MNVASNNTIVIIPKATKQTSIAMNPLMVRIFSQVISYLLLDPFFMPPWLSKQQLPSEQHLSYSLEHSLP